MAVLIKGMEMPKSCWDCYFQDCGNCLLNSHKAVDKNIVKDRIDEDCPLIEVPEPHGRLGDLDALDIYQRAEAAHAEYQEDENNEYLEGMADGLCEAAKQLSVARTIIPASEEGE